MTNTTKSLDLKRRLRDAATEEQRQALLDGLPHEVGFAKPPKSTRFKPGQSGNPRGRPKGARDLGLMMIEALDQQVEVTENGRRRKRSKAKVAVVQLANKAASGDVKAFQTYVEILRRSGYLDKPAIVQEKVFDSQDVETASQLLRFYSPDSRADEEGGVQ